MKHKLKKIKEDSQKLCNDISSDLYTSQDHLNQIAGEYQRVAKLSSTPAVVIEEIDRQFKDATKLTNTDVAFLFLASALQCIRQYILTPMTERVSDQEAAKIVKGKKREHSNRKHRLYQPSLEEIITNPVPFDANVGAAGALAGFGFLGHRGATPGHDPILGLAIGTANIATSTLTNWRLESFHVYSGTVGNIKGIRDILSCRAETPLVMSYTMDKLLHQGIDGKIIIGCSIQKEIQHLHSDLYSMNSLPLPIVSAIDPKLAGELAKRGLDMANTIDVGKQFSYAVLIDTLIALIHGLFYNKTDDGPQSLYEVRTRRILLYSNLIATTSNVLISAMSSYVGGGEVAGKLIDYGGYLNTLRRLAFDTHFIQQVKRDFLKNELHARIIGAEYDF